jgi:DivIVA domain-containing protein
VTGPSYYRQADIMEDAGNTPSPPSAVPFRRVDNRGTSPETIRAASFRTVRKGFDTREVRDFLERLASEVEALRDQIRSLEAEAAASPSTQVADLMRRFGEEAAALERQAEAAAEAARASARAEADEILRDARIRHEEAAADAAATVAAAQSEADRMLREARSKAEAFRRGIEAARRTAVGDLSRMHDVLLKTLVGLDAAGTSDETPGQTIEDVIVVADATDDTRSA